MTWWSLLTFVNIPCVSENQVLGTGSSHIHYWSLGIVICKSLCLLIFVLLDLWITKKGFNTSHRAVGLPFSLIVVSVLFYIFQDVLGQYRFRIITSPRKTKPFLTVVGASLTRVLYMYKAYFDWNYTDVLNTRYLWLMFAEYVYFNSLSSTFVCLCVRLAWFLCNQLWQLMPFPQRAQSILIYCNFWNILIYFYQLIFKLSICPTLPVSDFPPLLVSSELIELHCPNSIIYPL